MLKILEKFVEDAKKCTTKIAGPFALMDLYLIEKQLDTKDKSIKLTELCERWNWENKEVKQFLKSIADGEELDFVPELNIVRFNGTKKQAPAKKKITKNSAQEFYEDEIEDANDNLYTQFVHFLLGQNEIEKPFRMLKWDTKGQISFRKFQMLLDLSMNNINLIIDTCYAIENHYKQYKNFYLTLRQWLIRSTSNHS